MSHPRELIKRLGIAGVLIAVVFLVRLVYEGSGPEKSHWAYFTGVYLLLIGFASYQVLRAIALIAVSHQTRSPLLQALHLRGVGGTLWEINRRRLTPGLRLPIIFTAWAAVIWGAVCLLWSTHSLDRLEGRLIGALGGNNDSTGVPICRVVTLQTPDNNLGRYYRALAGLSGDLLRAGAKTIMAEQSRYEGPSSPWKGLLDTLRASGVILFESGEGRPQSLPLRNPPPGEWRHARLLEQGRLLPEERPVMIAFRPVPSWYEGVQVHAALQAVAQLRGERMIQQPYYVDGTIRYADLQIPVTSEGEAFAGVDGRVRKSFAGVAILNGGNDSLQYMDELAPWLTTSLPPSLATRVRGQMVLVRWFDTGGFSESWKDARGFVLPSIIEALQRGRQITPASGWHDAITLLVLLLGIGLAAGKHLRVASGVLIIVAAVILAADVWLVSSQLVMASLIYPAAAAVLAGILFPLAAYFHRRP